MEKLHLGSTVNSRGRRQAAETLALEALAFLGSAETWLSRFVEESGIDPQTLRARAGDPVILAAVLDFLLAEDERLLAFCAAQEIAPRDVHLARHALDSAP